MAIIIYARILFFKYPVVYQWEQMKPPMKKFLPIILILLSPMALSKDANTLSSIDSAYTAALEDESKKPLFYNAFINAEIFIPTHEPSESEQNKPESENETIAPMFIETDGVNYLVLFDSKQRLTNWTKTEVDFVALPGHAIVERMSEEFHWVLNPNTKHVKTFNPEEINWLKKAVALAKIEQSKLPKGTNVLIGEPPVIPDGLIDSLVNNLSSNTEVKRAYLGQVFYQVIDKTPHLALVLEVSDVTDAAMNAIRSDIVIATNGLLGESKYLDIMLAGESGLADEIIMTVKPFYVVRK
jgi:hypothetical protein